MLLARLPSRPRLASPRNKLYTYAPSTRKAPMAGSKKEAESEVWPQRRQRPSDEQTPSATSTSSTQPTPSSSSLPTSPQVLASWAEAYVALCRDAERMGIPRSAIPPLPPAVDGERLRRARENLEGMIQSFLSAGL